MSYYGISVVITILATAVTAFYLLYRAKELNLGILFSITAGSIVLGLSFNPAFKFLLVSLSESININKKVVLVLFLFVVLLIFLLFICILSMVISILMPKKFSSIDCGIYIDKFFSNIKNMTEEVFKKPVDTNQIIDTMGIENSENGNFLMADCGNYGTVRTEVDETTASVAEPYMADDFNASEDEGFENGSTDTQEFKAAEIHIIETDLAESGLQLSGNIGIESDRVEEAGEDTCNITVDTASQPEPEKTGEVEITARSLVEKAFESKDRGRKDQAVEYYMQALSRGPDKEMIFWIVLDVCALYKQLGLTELAQSILEGIVDRFGAAIKPDIKEEIIKNLK